MAEPPALRWVGIERVSQQREVNSRKNGTRAVWLVDWKHRMAGTGTIWHGTGDCSSFFGVGEKK